MAGVDASATATMAALALSIVALCMTTVVMISGVYCLFRRQAGPPASSMPYQEMTARMAAAPRS
jgi:hypothetical protein